MEQFQKSLLQELTLYETIRHTSNDDLFVNDDFGSDVNLEGTVIANIIARFVGLKEMIKTIVERLYGTILEINKTIVERHYGTIPEKSTTIAKRHYGITILLSKTIAERCYSITNQTNKTIVERHYGNTTGNE
ncbi:GTP-binding protein SAR1B [Gossypium australe]|uniref:GTP-binding protein SAR1B n=1 Tax=Gossypium australe TaxID=47621 RepID=A0A5B6X0H0_9ROSI|nr:GTP-binding protein SAR1B [Gossypium australe]